MKQGKVIWRQGKMCLKNDHFNIHFKKYVVFHYFPLEKENDHHQIHYKIYVVIFLLKNQIFLQYWIELMHWCQAQNCSIKKITCCFIHFGAIFMPPLQLTWSGSHETWRVYQHAHVAHGSTVHQSAWQHLNGQHDCAEHNM